MHRCRESSTADAVHIQDRIVQDDVAKKTNMIHFTAWVCVCV